MAIDLSEQHAPVSDLFPQPSTPEEWKLHRLTEEQLAFYEENGYVAGVHVLNDAQVEALRRELADSLIRRMMATSSGTSITPTSQPARTRCSFTPWVRGVFGSRVL